MLASLIKKYPIQTLCLIFAIVLLPNLHVLDVTIMEARNFITAREMITDNNWLLTTMNGEARYEKPPLPTWLTAISGLIFGIDSVFAMRLPAALMVILLVTFIYKISYKLTHNQTFAFNNGLILGSSFYVIGIIIEAPWDIFTHALMSVAIYYLILLFQESKLFIRHLFLVSFFIGLSFLSKGPISIYALFLPFLIAYGFTYKYKPLPKKILIILGLLLLGIALGGWWYVFVRINDPETFTAIAERETGNWSSYNVRPFYYYWSFFTQSGLWTIPAFISLLYPYLKSRVNNLKAYQFSLLWTLMAVVLLSIIPEKKSRYLMPVLIPLSINITFYIDYLIREFKNIKDKRETIPVYFNFGLIGLIGLIFGILGYWYLQDALTGYWAIFTVTALLLFIIGFSIFKSLQHKDLSKTFYLSFSFFAILLVIGLPLKNTFSSTEYHPIDELKKTDDRALYQLNYIAPELIWQYGAKIPPIKSETNTIELPKEDIFGLLTIGASPEDFEILQNSYEFEKITVFDLNRVSKDSRQYKDRLKANYYVLTKK
ncbi:glycosyltransferase [Hanstruepera neustonica]|uniref:Glycosyltransferase n=1 Tax=Hanstruepera neustonica TaxID=1445657 RepID=A0A2K1DVR5_9FLAO|nr:glycosyltransferase [Hanstruepera neustonica]PNQ72138.1 glycosyltransferase [Hanstruepera neustonica]